MTGTTGFHYVVSWRASSRHPGAHPAALSGGGHEFAGHRPFLAHPNPRHLDMRASLRDPFGQLSVRTFRQRSQVPVFVLADLSPSMGFSGTASRMEMLARFASAAAWSALSLGDPFGFAACDDGFREDLFLPLRLHRQAGPELHERLAGLVPARQRTGSRLPALMQAVEHLGRRRALVFLVSDFHFPLEQAGELLDALSRHDVVPVVLWDKAEYADLPRWGLVYLEDPETGERRRLFMRPAFRERVSRAYLERRQALVELARRYGRPPFFVEDDFDAEVMSLYFVSGLPHGENEPAGSSPMGG